MEIDGKKTLVIYGYKVRITDIRFWNRYYGVAKLRVSGAYDAVHTYDSEPLLQDNLLAGQALLTLIQQTVVVGVVGQAAHGAGSILPQQAGDALQLRDHGR